MGSRDKVLIVDDSELDRIALKKMLKDAYEIVEAVDGAGALRILESQKEFDAISAIILDLVMPQMDGFDFLREYRKVDSYRRIPVIVASVERDVKTEKACLALGARDFIGKPYDPQIVRFRVENAVRSSEQMSGGAGKSYDAGHTEFHSIFTSGEEYLREHGGFLCA